MKNKQKKQFISEFYPEKKVNLKYALNGVCQV